MTDVVPLFATLPASTQGAATPRPFGELLPAQPIPPASSPWSPKPVAAPAAGAAPGSMGPSAAEVDARAHQAAVDQAKQEAIAQGRAEGLRETEELRAKLKQLVGELEQTREARTDRYAEAIADAAVTAIDAWVGASDRVALFQPIVRAWIAAANGAAATARVNPADIAAIRSAIGDAAIGVESDASIAPGNIEIRSESLDTTHVWRDRLRELRDAIATALEHDGASAPVAATSDEAAP